MKQTRDEEHQEQHPQKLRKVVALVKTRSWNHQTQSWTAASSLWCKLVWQSGELPDGSWVHSRDSVTPRDSYQSSGKWEPSFFLSPPHLHLVPLTAQT